MKFADAFPERLQFQLSLLRQMIVERGFSATRGGSLPTQPAWRLSQESQNNIVIVDISRQTRHLSYPPSNLFDFSAGIYAKKYEKTQFKPFERSAKIEDQAGVARLRGPAQEKC